jgi:hypothetical protein
MKDKEFDLRPMKPNLLERPIYEDKSSPRTTHCSRGIPISKEAG